MSDEGWVLSIGEFEIKTPYRSWYPEEYQCLRILYVCQFCLKYEKSEEILEQHEDECLVQRPPGNEIYSKGPVSIFEIDGEKHHDFCENLFLLAKLFLENMFYGVGAHIFLFYVLTVKDKYGCNHIIGFFSKPNDVFNLYNISCLLVFPQYRRKGFGRMLIELSYIICKKEGKISTPEQPLSELGKIAFLSYWRETILEYVEAHKKDGIEIRKMSEDTAIKYQDIFETLSELNLLNEEQDKCDVVRRIKLLKESRQKAKQRFPETIIDPSCLQIGFSLEPPLSSKKVKKRRISVLRENYRFINCIFSCFSRNRN